MNPYQSPEMPGQVEAALRFLKFLEEARTSSLAANPTVPRPLARTETEVQDSALTVLLEYFNQPLPDPTIEYPGSSDQRSDDDIPF